jgi:uncharacterized protein YndB with AHSA1/START domain
VFVRVLPHAPHKVWSALTDPAQLREWAPFDADRDLGTTGEATLTMAGGAEPEALPATVRHAEPARLLEYTWGDDVLRWELEASGSGTRLTLRHTIDDRDWIPSVLAGWHICLDVADRLMAGRPVGRIVADEARDHGWGRLKDAYAERLGIGAAAEPDGGRRSG